MLQLISLVAHVDIFLENAKEPDHANMVRVPSEFASLIFRTCMDSYHLWSDG